MKGLFTLVSILFLSTQAFAFPEAPFNALEIPRISKSVDMSDYDFNGIVALSNCSGSVVRFAGQPASSQAYLLTNGHCINTGPFGGFLQPGEVRYNKPQSRSVRIYDRNGGEHRHQTDLLVYATMTDTDSAIYRLRATYQELESQGIDSFELSSDMPMIGQNIEIVSGYWEKGFSCSVEHIVFQLREDDWTFVDSIRYSGDGCQVYGGTSGSPVIATHSRIVAGVNNTGNESGRRCTMNNPCEVDVDGNILVLHKRGYGQQTYLFYDCLTVDFQLDIHMKTCQLPN